MPAIADVANLFPPPPQAGPKVDADIQNRLFDEAWHRLQRRFFKLETLQLYDETGVPAFDAWKRGDWEEVQRLARARVFEEQRDVYELVRDRRIEFTRVRILRLPPSDYVRFEREVYHHASEAGERILGILEQDLPENLRGLYDFLLLDSKHVFVHDYDKSGERIASWVIDDLAYVERYAAVASRLVEIAEPFDQLEARHF